MRKKLIILLVAFLGMQLSGLSQNGPGSETLIINIGDGKVSQQERGYNEDITHLIVIERPGAADLGSVAFCLDIDSFPNLRTLELLNIQTTIFSLAGKTRSGLEHVFVSLCPAFDLKHGIDFLSRYANIQTLSIEGMSEVILPSTIKRMRGLSSLTVTNCDMVDMKHLLDVIQRNKYLDRLVISGNFDVRFPLRYKPDRYVSHLDLSENYLFDIPTWILDPKGLQYLNISGNEIYLPDLLLELKQYEIDTLVADIRQADDTLLVKQMLPATVKSYVFDTLIYSGSGTVFTGFPRTDMGTLPHAFSYKHRSLNRPLPGVDVPFSEYTGEGGTEQVIRTAGGTRISIPAGALVTKDGEEVKDDYKIYYRDLTDPVSMFLSGVPMNIDSGGQRQEFESAGMFEIYAFSDTSMLQLRQGQSMNIEFPSPSTDEDFDLYFYDDAAGTWVKEEGEANKVNKQERPRIYSRAYRLVYRLFNFAFDTSTFDTRYELPQYARTRKLVNYFWGKKKDLWPYMRIRKVRVKDSKRGQILFRFPYVYSRSKRKYIISTSAFRELGVYSSYNWLYAGNLSRQDFIKTYSRGKKWTDVRIEYDETAGNYSIILKSPQEEAVIPAVLYMPNIKDEEKLERTYAKLDKRYERSLSRIEASFNRSIERSKARDLRKDWKAIRAAMAREELEMPREEWIAYALQTIEMSAGLDSVYSSNLGFVTRDLQVRGFGIWNCDRIRKLPQGPKVLASVVDADGKQVIPSEAFMINKTVLGVISLTIENNKISYRLPGDNVYAMCFFDENGQLYVTHFSEFSDPVTISKTKQIRANKLDDPNDASLHLAIGF
jgi:hypothetical protein